ncbi:hypothetical protein G9C85_17700 [Halorubellus sp. JP-L1]|uniref:hypothetical protein n=1 Tax=Halorubellus sp. JP-L1 TaxID=2715753 RepID=UPI0014087AEF|nr:hypothetical protein [Halorubellus sp. JP-L1]NHN43455.1 hypothetical protein [Halorubellus sp. JP-L1]
MLLTLATAPIATSSVLDPADRTPPPCVLDLADRTPPPCVLEPVRSAETQLAGEEAAADARYWPPVTDR